MAENEKDEGRWQGVIETKLEAIGVRVKRLEAIAWAVLSAFAAIGAKAMGFWP